MTLNLINYYYDNVVENQENKGSLAYVIGVLIIVGIVAYVAYSLFFVRKTQQAGRTQEINFGNIVKQQLDNIARQQPTVTTPPLTTQNSTTNISTPSDNINIIEERC